MYITLSMQLKLIRDRVYMAFYCNIEEVKEGYIFVDFGRKPQDVAMWIGLNQVIAPLYKSYRHYKLKLAFPKIYMTIGNDKCKGDTTRMLESFPLLDFIDGEQYEDELLEVIKYGINQNIPIGTLKGIKKDDWKKRDIKQKNVDKVEYKYYEGVGVPSSGIVLDFETTSTNSNYARIIEISALRFKDGCIVDSYNTLVNPGIKIPKSVRELTKIKQEDVQDAPDSFKAMRGLSNFIKNERLIVGHNIAYDYRLMVQFYRKFNYRIWNGELLCTKKLAQSSQIVLPDYKLETLCDFFNINNENPHRAYSDTQATFKVMNKLFETCLLV